MLMYKLIVKCWAEQMCLEGTTEGWVRVDGTDGGGETVPYVGAGHWESTPSELRPASFDGSGSSSGGAKPIIADYVKGLELWSW